MLPEEFMNMSWADWQRHAQGHIIRNARYMAGVRRSAYFTLLAAGAKRIREEQLFEIVTDPKRKVPVIKPEERLTTEQLDRVMQIYFTKKPSKLWPSQKRG